MVDLLNNSRVLFISREHLDWVHGHIKENTGRSALGEMLTYKGVFVASLIFVGDISDWPHWTEPREFEIVKNQLGYAFIDDLIAIAEDVRIIKENRGWLGGWVTKIALTGRDVFMMKLLLAPGGDH